MRHDLDEVLAVRRERHASVRDLLSTLTDDRLDEIVSAEGGAGRSPAWRRPSLTRIEETKET